MVTRTVPYRTVHANMSQMETGEISISIPILISDVI